MSQIHLQILQLPTKTCMVSGRHHTRNIYTNGPNSSTVDLLAVVVAVVVVRSMNTRRLHQ